MLNCSYISDLLRNSSMSNNFLHTNKFNYEAISNPDFLLENELMVQSLQLLAENVNILPNLVMQ